MSRSIAEEIRLGFDRVLRSVTQTITGTVAVSSSALPTGAATSAKQDTGNASLASVDGKTPSLVSGRVPVDGSGVTQPVSGTVAVSGSVAVTGTFWQATQPVSGTVAATQSGTWTLGANSGVDIGDVTINNASGVSAVNIQDGGNSITVDGTVAATQSGTWTVTGAGGTFPVTGTFWQATQPVSIATAPVLVAGSAVIGKVGIDQTTPGTTNLIALSAETTKVIGTVNPPALTIGENSANGFTTQPARDAGRTPVRFYAAGVASGTTGTETAINLFKSSGNSATGSAQASWVLTSGKRLRIQAITFASRGHNTATAQITTFRLRVNTAGAVTTTSTPIELAIRSATPATANAWDRVFIPIPDGWELLGDGTIQFGITANAVFTTNAPTWDVTIIGFEY